ncbi:carboxypeptidase-like regulatory domain-containing protein [Chitinophaga niabensis]|uniref:CarboxypepD_reg-like domain-containing protein n=1 Tax=Chitinophaga niabensis TaxID=536979 RepID=A0A1N6DGC0_9BACT|nr:carboxypeptidase-like regulatory domain-containing protein [Chitinophaga niabensis]SIN69842.1 CarboxypepD_reg-like domain-containing protein [Chitinophaga niabensis]
MHKLMLLSICAMLTALTSLQAQEVISGTVRNSVTKEVIPAVSVVAKNTPNGDYSSDQGHFRFTTKSKFPVTLVFSSLGFKTKEIEISSAKPLQVELTPTTILGTEVVVSASRNVQRKIESPVTIERIDNKDIINSPQTNYYNMLQGLKGVDITTSSLTFTTITTRGFNTSGNTNFTQIVDGMDNSAPGLNFPLGAAIGLTELDVDNLEVLSGASSALYGSRGLNGTLVMTGKDPFKYQGLSVQITQGVNHVKKGKGNDPMGPQPYYDWTLRWAKKVNEKLAFKFNLQYTMAKEWMANDTSNTNGPGSRYTDPNYNGVNSYGSKTSVDINPFLQAALAGDPSLAPIIDPLLEKPSNYVSRTGYAEYGYLSDEAKLLKLNAEVRYKIKPKLEAIISGTYGQGNSVYSNDTRYALTNFRLGQYRVELKAEHWFLRGYTSRENSGNTIIASPTAQLLNEAWKPSFDPSTMDGWYPQYTGALLQALATGSSLNDAHLAARSFADQGRPAAGSARFNHLKDSIAGIPTSRGGTLFQDRSKLYNAEFQYNLSHFIKVIDVIAGLNYRLFRLDSKGTLFPDTDGPIDVAEYSAYAHLAKKLIDNKLRLGAAFRYDKNTLFSKPRITSRLSGVVEVAKENFLRFSYQNAYSFPSNIQSLQSTLVDYNSFASGGSARLLYGEYGFDKYPAYTLTSVQEYQQSNDPSKLEKFRLSDIKPQSVDAFELGYSALISNVVLIDVLGYYSTWKNFIGYVNVANTPGTEDVTAFKDRSKYIAYNIAYNGAETVNTYGYAASVSVDLSRNFGAKANFSSDFLKNRNNSQINNFNTPNWKFNVEFGNSGFGKQQKLSFNTSLRYKPAYFYSIGFGSGTIPANVVLDAQFSYKLIKAHSKIKIGATNLTNRYYYTGFGSPAIGGVYYVTFAYNVF